MSSCVAGGAELEPPVRIPHTIYVKSLYRIAGQDYCRHHIIKAAVVAGVIAEVKAGAGPVVVVPGIESCETAGRHRPTGQLVPRATWHSVHLRHEDGGGHHHHRRFGQSLDIRILTDRPHLATMDPSLH